MLENESMFRGLLDAVPDAIVGISADGLIVLVNAQTEVLFGYDRDDLVGQPVEVLVPDEAWAIHPSHSNGYLAHPETRPMGAGRELAGRRRDGTEFPAEISLSAIDTGKGTLVIAVIRDGTERKQAAIVNSSSDAIVSMDLDGTITSWNRSAEAFYGQAAAAVLGRSIEMLIPPDELEAERQILTRARRGESIPEHETVRVRADGSVIHVSCSTAPILDGERVTGILTISRDISERKRAEAQRRALEDRLHQSERLESLGQLAGGIAHDFNNLLSVILNYAVFVAEETQSEAVRADIDEIRSAAERAARLTHQLLIFGRRETAQPEVLDVHEIVTNVHQLLSRTIEEHVELVLLLTPSPATVRADRGQMEQVLLNLAVNARDAMPAGGILTIETTHLEVAADTADQLNVEPGNYVQLSVSDTGSGMDAATIAHAFEPFFTTKAKGKGTGLGLATVYGIVTEAGGAVTLYSESQLGTTVRVYLRTAEDPAPARRVEDRRQPPSGAGVTVLVVDDEEAIRKVTARILVRNDYSVLQAATGADALSLAADQPVDLLLTDVVMPSMSGLELAERIRALRPDLFVLLMSGYSQGVLGPQREMDEEVHLIQKPFSEQGLITKLNEMCTGSPVPIDTDP